METGSLKIHGVTKIKEEITYANARKTQVRSYDFTNDLGTINVTLFMADEPTVVEAYNSVKDKENETKICSNLQNARWKGADGQLFLLQRGG